VTVEAILLDVRGGSGDGQYRQYSTEILPRLSLDVLAIGASLLPLTAPPDLCGAVWEREQVVVPHIIRIGAKELVLRAWWRDHAHL
jgi:hypothetical protein